MSRTTDETRTRRRVVKLLKTEGPLDSATLAKRLKVTPMAVRQHLYALKRRSSSRRGAAGAAGPSRQALALTRAADRLFPDAYAERTRPSSRRFRRRSGRGMTRLLDSRLARHETTMPRGDAVGTPGEKSSSWLKSADEEGYMAKSGAMAAATSSSRTIARFAPAATRCQGFCATELELFRSALGPGVTVERAEHILSGDRRCAYRIAPTL